MNDHENIDEKVEDLIEDQDKISKQIELSNLNLGIVVRTECVNIITNVINSWLTIKQKTKNPLTEEELKAIQGQINAENNITKDMYNNLEKLLKKETK